MTSKPIWYCDALGTHSATYEGCELLVWRERNGLRFVACVDGVMMPGFFPTIAEAKAEAMNYVGTALEFGITLDRVWDEIHRSNMAKRDPVTGKVKRRKDGKVLKPDGWKRPDVAAALATPEPVKPHVGLKLWYFDESHRVYQRDPNGRATGGPIWREHWRETYIVGETSRSWLIGPAWTKNNIKAADKLAKRSFPGNYATSEEEIDRQAFVQERRGLARLVENCIDFDTLKRVEAALGAKL